MKGLVILFSLFLMAFFSKAQESITIPTNSETKKSTIQLDSENSILFTISFNEIVAAKKNKEDGNFISITAQNLQKQFGKGDPNIPVYSKLIEVPGKDAFKIIIDDYSEQLIKLSEYNISDKIEPTQLSLSKSADPNKTDHYFNEDVYNQNKFLYSEITKIEYLGEMRGRHLARIEILPIQYNPVLNQLKILNDLAVKIEFTETFDNSDKYKSNAFNTLIDNATVNERELSLNKSLITAAPITYVIISDPMFEATLQPFIEWKIKSGFQIIEKYTDDPLVGNSTTSIKTFLQDLYENPSSGFSPPEYVLFVGDVAQIPAFNTQTGGSHVTDLHYCEYTGDFLPEVMYGRFSAESVAELEPQLAKTLTYEQYTFADDSFIDDVVLVAGVEPGEGITHGNSQIYYAWNEYFTTATGFEPHVYLYSSGTDITTDQSIADDSIIADLSKGVGFANYTGHCSSSGWSNPVISRSSIDLFSNSGKFGTFLGNCCESNKFTVDDCFGEKIVQASNKGAVGYIGGNDLTYWDEDFWFAVGLNSLSLNVDNAPLHTYENTGPGIFDGVFHNHGETTSEWYITNFQFVLAGNLAVSSSTSSLKNYYWEVYSLFGDPSLVTYLNIPTILGATYNSTIPVGSTNLYVETLPYAHVTLSENGIILDSKIANETGNITLLFDPLATPGADQLDIVITAQNKIPHIENITVTTPSGPYIVIDTVAVNDVDANNNNTIDFGETINLVFDFKNVGQDDATNVIVDITTSDTNIISTTSNTDINIGDIASNTEISVSNKFYFEIANNLDDQHEFIFNSSITDDSGETYTSIFKLTGNAPVIEYVDFAIDDSETGNSDGILDLGETAKLLLRLKNAGHSPITNINASLININNSEDYLTIIDSAATLANLPDDDLSYELEFTVQGMQEIDSGSVADINFLITAGIDDQYELVQEDQIIIGIMPEFNISAGGTHTISSAYFYDSGGESSNYSNYENYTITFEANISGNQLKCIFEAFDIEEKSGGGCWDYLEVYDGLSTSSDQIGAYCKTNPPDTIISNNQSGALTFRFYSDESYTRLGWKAKLTSITIPKYNVYFTVASNDVFLENAAIQFYNQLQQTDANGEAVFTDIPSGTNADYSVNLEGYIQETGTIYVTDQDVYEIIDLTEIPTYSVSFLIMHNDENISDASVVFNEDTLITDKTGLVTFDGFYEGNSYSYSIKATYFENYNGSLLIPGYDTIVEIYLTELPKYELALLVTDGVNALENATVAVEYSIKLTNSEGIAAFNLYSGIYGIRVLLEDYFIYNDTIILEEKDTIVEIELQKSVFEVEFQAICKSTATFIENATLIIDGTEYYTNEEGKVSLSLDYGEHTVSGTAYGYKNYNISTIEINSDTIINLEFFFEEYAAIFNVHDELGNAISSAEIYINDSVYNVEENGEKIIDLYIGEYFYKIIADGYYSDSAKIIIDAHDTTLNCMLKLIQFNLKFRIKNENNFTIENAEVTINDSTQLSNNLGEVNYTLVPGNYSYSVNKEGFSGVNNHAIDIVDSDIFETVILQDISNLTFGITFKVFNRNADIIEGASLTLSGITKFTNVEGSVVFDDIQAGTRIDYTAVKTGYEQFNGTVASLDSNMNVDIYLTEIVSISNVSENIISIFPNPTSGKLTIKGLTKNSFISLFDITGNQLMKESANQETEIDISFVEKGIYLLKVESNSSEKVFRIIRK